MRGEGSSSSRWVVQGKDSFSHRYSKGIIVGIERE